MGAGSLVPSWCQDICSLYCHGTVAVLLSGFAKPGNKTVAVPWPDTHINKFDFNSQKYLLKCSIILLTLWGLSKMTSIMQTFSNAFSQKKKVCILIPITLKCAVDHKTAQVTQKQKGCEGDCPGRHWGRWSLPSTSPVTSRALILTIFPIQWMAWHWAGNK